jgi:antitoxin VapB
MMLMPISIRDPETDRLAREVAALTGESLTSAINVALKERLARERAHRDGRVARLLAIGERCAAQMGPGARSTDHAELFYDEVGLPR